MPRKWKSYFDVSDVILAKDLKNPFENSDKPKSARESCREKGLHLASELMGNEERSYDKVSCNSPLNIKIPKKKKRNSRLAKIQTPYYQKEYARKQFAIDRNQIPDFRIVDYSVPKGKTILSVGCGAANDVRYLSSSNLVFGVDIMLEAIEAAKKNGIKAIQTNIEEGLPFEAEKFDLVVCKEILEHLFDPQFVLSEIHRVLRRDGAAFLSVPNHFWYWHRLRILLGKGIIQSVHARDWNEWNYFHIRFFTFDGFNRLIKETGFRITKYYYPDKISDIFAPKKLQKLNFLIPKALARKTAAFKPNFFLNDFCVKVVKKSN